MGSLCSSERKFAEDECIPEKASGRYSSLNPSRRCSFMLETPRPSTADNAAFAKSSVMSPIYKGTVGMPGNMTADQISQAIELDCSDPLFTPLLIKLLRPARNQDPFHHQLQDAQQGEQYTPWNSSQGSPAASPLRWSLDVEVTSSGRPSWHEQRSWDDASPRGLLELTNGRNQD